MGCKECFQVFDISMNNVLSMEIAESVKQLNHYIFEVDLIIEFDLG